MRIVAVQLQYCRLFLTRIERKYECDLYLADLTEFGLTLQSRAPALPNQAGLHLIPDMVSRNCHLFFTKICAVDKMATY